MIVFLLLQSTFYIHEVHKLADAIAEFKNKKQDLAEAAANIQQLLQQLQQSQDITLEQAQHQVATEIVNQAKKDQSFRTKITSLANKLLNVATTTTVEEVAKGVFTLVLSWL